MKEWYLNYMRPNITSGYENDAISEYAQDNFTDVLETTFSDTVLLYDYSLTNCKEIRCIIQGNTADTQLKSMERIILAPIGTLHSGDYVFFENEYWIVDGRPGNNKSYEKATLKECQYKLRWQKDDGSIVERWANLVSASKYDDGENRNNIIILTSNTYTVIIPNDADSRTIDGKRVFIDLSDIPEKVFEITRNDDVLFNHGVHGGTLSLIADKREFDKEKDNQELRICNYINTSSSLSGSENTDETTNLSAKITSNGSLKVGFYHTYTVNFTDKNGADIDWNTVDFLWNVDSDFVVEQSTTDNIIKLKVSDEDQIGSSFLLKCIVDDIVVGSMEIVVCDIV